MKLLKIPLLDVEFRGDSREALKGFPELARRRAGRQLQMVQRGQPPMDWKPIRTVGPGVRELRVRDESGAFRLIYVATIAGIVFVLHCFQKKTQKTGKADIDLATKRYKELIREYSNERKIR